jgi:hypothetical protein
MHPCAVITLPTTDANQSYLTKDRNHQIIFNTPQLDREQSNERILSLCSVDVIMVLVLLTSSSYTLAIRSLALRILILLLPFFAMNRTIKNDDKLKNINIKASLKTGDDLGMRVFQLIQAVLYYFRTKVNVDKNKFVMVNKKNNDIVKLCLSTAKKIKSISAIEDNDEVYVHIPLSLNRSLSYDKITQDEVQDEEREYSSLYLLFLCRLLVVASSILLRNKDENINDEDYKRMVDELYEIMAFYSVHSHPLASEDEFVCPWNKALECEYSYCIPFSPFSSIVVHFLLSRFVGEYQVKSEYFIPMVFHLFVNHPDYMLYLLDTQCVKTILEEKLMPNSNKDGLNNKHSEFTKVIIQRVKDISKQLRKIKEFFLKKVEEEINKDGKYGEQLSWGLVDEKNGTNDESEKKKIYMGSAGGEGTILREEEPFGNSIYHPVEDVVEEKRWRVFMRLREEGKRVAFSSSRRYNKEKDPGVKAETEVKDDCFTEFQRMVNVGVILIRSLQIFDFEADVLEVIKKHVRTFQLFGEFFLDYITHIVPSKTQLIMNCVDQLQQTIYSVEKNGRSVGNNKLVPGSHIFVQLREKEEKRLVSVFKIGNNIVPYAVLIISSEDATCDERLKKEIKHYLKEQGEKGIGTGTEEDFEVVGEEVSRDIILYSHGLVNGRNVLQQQIEEYGFHREFIYFSLCSIDFRVKWLSKPLQIFVKVFFITFLYNRF